MFRVAIFVFRTRRVHLRDAPIFGVIHSHIFFAPPKLFTGGSGELKTALLAAYE
jgi:hypothetical protein